LIGPDPFDNYNPPPFLPLPEVNFYQTSIPQLHFGNDMVPTQKEFTWNFSTKGEIGKVNELSWNNSINTSGLQLYLYDESDLSLVDMATVDHYQFTQHEKSTFKIYFGSDVIHKIVPDELQMKEPFPNPVTSERIAFFTLAVPSNNLDAHVNIQIFNSIGVQIYNRNETASSGLHQIKYEFPAEEVGGLYFYRLIVGQGQSSVRYTGKIVVP
jgi:hypothetical protein